MKSHAVLLVFASVQGIACSGSQDLSPYSAVVRELGEDGSITVRRARPKEFGASTGAEMVRISAPVIPQVSVLYQSEGAEYPATMEGEIALAKASALTFERLLEECRNDYPGIVIPGAEPLSDEQRNQNYALVDQCALARLGTNPYWMPLLVDRVDICGITLGRGWRLLHESDMASFREEDLQGFVDALDGIPTPAPGYFFSTDTYARAADGSLGQAPLYPGSTRVHPLPILEDERKLRFDGGLHLRCIGVGAAQG
ncbi:MAG: hypothetical protein HY698_20925 [Deltaproteobacteria bacterium]|nr:hypothetical protein [Deltaproteobacteria bacterium]